MDEETKIVVTMFAGCAIWALFLMTCAGVLLFMLGRWTGVW